MFIGHFGVGFAAKRFAPQVSLGVLFLGAQFIDLLWPSLLLVGWERVAIAPGATVLTPLDFQHYPISHSLLAVIAWATVLGGGHFALYREKRAAWVLTLLVLSHWMLDALVHRPDLPLAPFSDRKVGLGLWNSPLLSQLVEMPLFFLGAWIYARVTKARDAAGRWGLWSLVGFLFLIQCGNLVGEPPPSVAAIAWVGQAQWLLVLWGFWLDQHRVPKGA